MNHKPGGGNVKITSKRQSFAGVKSKCGTFDKVNHTPGGGKVKIQSRRVSMAGVTSKVGSLDKVTHVPGGGKVEIHNQKPKFEVSFYLRAKFKIIILYLRPNRKLEAWKMRNTFPVAVKQKFSILPSK